MQTHVMRPDPASRSGAERAAAPQHRPGAAGRRGRGRSGEGAPGHHAGAHVLVLVLSHRAAAHQLRGQRGGGGAALLQPAE